MERLTLKGYVYDNSNFIGHGILAMTNKLQEYEDAEEQGLLLRLPVAIGGTVWGWEYPTIVKEDGLEYTVCDIRRAKVVPKEFILIMLGRIGTSYFLTREEAEKALEDMKGGK